jgi:hypothetical protein
MWELARSAMIRVLQLVKFIPLQLHGLQSHFNPYIPQRTSLVGFGIARAELHLTHVSDRSGFWTSYL